MGGSSVNHTQKWIIFLRNKTENEVINNSSTNESKKLIVADPGAPGHYLTVRYISETWESIHLVMVKLSDGQLMQNTHALLLPIPVLSNKACLACIFPQLIATLLLSLGQICKGTCTVTIDNKDIIIKKRTHNHIHVQT